MANNAIPSPPPYATASIPGTVSVTTQSFAGNKDLTGTWDVVKTGGDKAGTFLLNNATIDYSTALSSSISQTAHNVAITALTSLYGWVDVSGNTGLTWGASGIAGEAYVSSSATVVRAIGSGGYAEMSGSGTVTHMSALFANTNARTAGTVTNNYGILIEDQTGIGTNNYQLYSNGTSPVVITPNGRLGVGIANPAYTLDVKGAGATSSTRSLNVTNSAGTAYVLFRDDGLLSVSPTSSSPRAFSIYETAGGTEIGMSIGGAPNAGMQSYISFSDGANGDDQIRYYPRSTTDQTFYFQDVSGGADSSQPKVAIGYDSSTDFSSRPAGSLMVLGDLAVDTNVLKVDSTNNRVGVNVTSPTVALDVTGEIKGSTTVTATTGFVVGTQKIYNGSAAPVAGTWVQGDIVFNTTPVAGGNVGWICVTGGTPGTWKEFGLVSV